MMVNLVPHLGLREQLDRVRGARSLARPRRELQLAEHGACPPDPHTGVQDNISIWNLDPTDPHRHQHPPHHHRHSEMIVIIFFFRTRAPDKSLRGSLAHFLM